MAIGYTISSLDSNESILEKLNKIEKYLRDNPLCNLYVSKQTYPTGANYILYSNILNSNIRPLINNGDLILFKNGFVGMVTAVDIDNDMVYYDNDNVVQIADGDHYVTGVEVLNPTPTTAQIRIDIAGSTSEYSNTFNIGGGGAGIDTIQVSEVGNQATITITDTDNNTYTSNSFSVGDTNTDTLIDTIAVTNPTPTTAQIEITDTANHTFTSNTFNVGGGGGSESVYVDSANTIISNLSSNPSPEKNYCVLLGYNASSSQDYNVGIGLQARVLGIDGVSIGSGASIDDINDPNHNPTEDIAIGKNAIVHSDYAVQIGNGINTTDYSIQFMSEQILSKATSLDPIKFSNELQLNCIAVPVMINSFTDNFASASSNGIQVTCDSNDSAHAQVTLSQLTSDTCYLM